MSAPSGCAGDSARELDRAPERLAAAARPAPSAPPTSASPSSRVEKRMSSSARAQSGTVLRALPPATADVHRGAAVVVGEICARSMKRESAQMALTP